MSLELLYKHIGSYNEQLDCLYPVYLLYPEIPKYKLVQDENYFQPLIEKYFCKTAESKEGDLLVFKFQNKFHFGIYNGCGKFFHCCKKFKLRLSRMKLYQKSLKGIYRWHH